MPKAPQLPAELLRIADAAAGADVWLTRVVDRRPLPYEAATMQAARRAAGRDMIVAKRSGTVMVDGVRHVIKAGVTRWRNRLPERYSDRRVADLFGTALTERRGLAKGHLPTRSSGRTESWRL